METRILTLNEFKLLKDVVCYVEIVVNVFDFQAPINFYFIGDLYDLMADVKYHDLNIYKEVEAITLMSENEFEIISLNQRGIW